MMKTPDSITVFESGNPSGIPLVLIHGGGGGVWAWDETTKYLGDFRCLLPELPEHGGSRFNGPFRIESAAQKITRAICERVPGGKAHFIGHSVGGQIVLEILSRAPETVSSAIVSGAQLLPVPGYHLGIYSETAMALVYWLGIFPWKNNAAWIRINMKIAAGIPESFFDRFTRNFQQLTRASWAHVMSENYRYRLPTGLEHARSPVLLIAGTRETVDIQPTVRLLRRVLPNARAFLVGEGRNWTAPQQHNWPMNAPELCAQTIRAWVCGSALPHGLVEF